MSIYSLSLNTTVTTTNNPCWEFLAQADQTPVVYEVHVQLGAATASSFGLGRAAVAGTQSGAVAVIPNGPGDATTGKSTCGVAWSVAPTVPVQYQRRTNLPATIGSATIWVFPDGLKVAASNSLVLWNLATNSASTNVTVVSEE
jgi:hypothetical protein